MKIDVGFYDDAYEIVADIIDKKMVEHYKYYADVLVELRTSNLGETIEYLKFYGDKPGWVWDRDWYEGGDVELISFIPLDEIKKLGDIPNAYSFGEDGDN